MKLEDINGIGKKRITSLHAANIYSLRDILYYFPIKYKDTTYINSIASVVEGDRITIEGRIQGKIITSYYNKISRTIINLADNSGNIKCVWFNSHWIKSSLTSKEKMLVHGKVYSSNGKLYLNNPTIENTKAIIPIYRKISNISQNLIINLVKIAIDIELNNTKDFIPLNFLNDLNILGLKDSIIQKHFPTSMELLQKASTRFLINDLIIYLNSLNKYKNKNRIGISINFNNQQVEKYWDSLKFVPTNSQKKVLNEILKDMKAIYPMSRLVQGDVGSGKTAVAFGAALICIQNGYQCVFMAPTEVLANQQFQYAKEYFKMWGIKAGILKGKQTTKERTEAYNNIKNGNWNFIVGTHALFSDTVEYKNVGLIITDEQHRFGVAQRKSLQKITENGALLTNVLVMSATPIPRSTALILLSDLDISTINEMPTGRKPPKTILVPENKREAMYLFINDEILKGKQAYLVCKYIDDNEEDSDVKTINMYYNELKETAISNVNIGILHGQQKQIEKEKTIDDFKNNKINALVSTTVIEVGINITNASIIVIENANMYGLSQLHQLRGRVGRDGSESWCFLMGPKNDRLEKFCKTNDGFEISKLDFCERGPGNLLGTEQHGSSFLSTLLINQSTEELVKKSKSILEQIGNNIEYNESKNILENETEKYIKEIDKEISLT